MKYLTSITAAILTIAILVYINPKALRKNCYCLPDHDCICPPNYILVSAVGIIIGILVCFAMSNGKVKAMGSPSTVKLQ